MVYKTLNLIAAFIFLASQSNVFQQKCLEINELKN